MKKNYIIPSTASVTFYAGSICQTSGGNMEIDGNGGLDYGGQGGGDSLSDDPM